MFRVINPFIFSSGGIGFGDDLLRIRGPSLGTNLGSGGDGTINGGLSTVANTESGGVSAFSFSDPNHWIEFASLGVGTADFSLGAWVKTTNPLFQYAIGKGIESASSDGYGLSTFEETGAVRLYGAIGDGTRQTFPRYGSVDSGWNLIVITFDRDGLARLYVNGVEVGTESISARSGSVGADTVYIGRFPNATSAGRYIGLIDDIAVGPRVWTTSEISAWYSAGRGYNA